MPGDDYGDLIEAAARRYDVDPNLIRSVMHVESRGNPAAHNRETNARGLMQLIPDTARRLGVNDPHDPAQAIPAAARLLAENLGRYGNAEEAVLAYHGGTDRANWGPRTRRYLQLVTDRYGQVAAPREAAPEADAASPAAAPVPPEMSPVSATAAVPARAEIPSRDAIDDFLMGTPQAPAFGQGQGDAIDRFLMGTGDGTAGAATPGVPAPPQRSAEAQGATFAGRMGRGFLRGVHDVVDTPAEWLAGAAEWSGLTDALKNSMLGRAIETAGLPISTARQTEEMNRQGRQDFIRDYGDSGAALLGRVGGNIAATAPILRAGGAVLRGAGAIGEAVAPGLANVVAPAARAISGAVTPSNPLLRFGARAARGAAEGGAAAGLMLDPDRDAADQIGFGAALGGAANAAIVPALRSGANALRGFMAPGVNPQIARLAQRAEALGIPIRGSQISDSPVVRWVDNTLDGIPGSGQLARNATQRAAFTRAVSNSIGENTDNITGDVLRSASRRIGGVMDDVAAKTTMTVDDAFINRLADIEQTLLRDPLPEGSLRSLQTQLDDALRVASSGEITGRAYQAFTRAGTPLSRARRSQDPNVRYFANSLRDAFDDLLERSAPEDLVGRLRGARQQWRAMVNVVEPLVEGKPVGQIEPSALMNRVRAAYPDYLRFGAGGTPLGDLAQIGTQFMPRTPNSGTAQRIAIGAGAANLGLSMADPSLLLTGLGATAGAAGASRLIGSALASNAYRNALLGQGNVGAAMRLMGRGGRQVNRLLQAGGVPGIVSAGRQDWDRGSPRRRAEAR